MLRQVPRSLLLLLLACGSDAETAPARQPPPVLPTKPTAEQNAAADRLLEGPEWYRHAVFYEVFVRSFQDSNGDGKGDLDGLTSRLPYLKDLGIDALWLMPIHPTPYVDSGYDIADFRGVNPDYGDMAAFERLIAKAHELEMRVVIDLVLNHTSSEHEWFKESRSSKTNPKADWYVWSDTPSRADLGDCKPDNPRFGNGWTFDATRGQYYYHRFYPGQPDLDYRNAEVVKETLDVLRFWLDKGVDGFRADVIGKLYESPEGCSMLPETIAYIKQMRALLDEKSVDRPRTMVAEPGELQGGGTDKYYGNGKDMFHMTFEFGYGYFWGLAFAQRDRRIIDDAVNRMRGYASGAQPAHVIGSHDVLRAWTSAGNDPLRYRDAALLQMTMRGTPFIYYGEELALRPGTQVIVDERDVSRTPMTSTREAGHGFTTGTPWIAFGEAPADTSVEAEDADPESMLTYYRQLLAFRRGHAVWGTGDMRLVEFDVRQIAAFTREDDIEGYLVTVNMSDEPQEGVTTGEIAKDPKLVFGDGEIAIDGTTVRVKLPARGAAIFRGK